MDIGGTFDIGDGPGDFEQPCDSPEREAESPYRLVHHLLRIREKRTVARHLGIVERAVKDSLPALFLPQEGVAHPCVEFAGSGPRSVVAADGVHLYIQVYPVEKRVGEAGAVAADLDIGAAAGDCGAKEVAAGTGVHRPDEEKIGVVGDLGVDPRYPDMAVLQRFAQRLENRFGKMGELVEKQDTAMRQPHLADLGLVGPPDISIIKCYLI